MTRHKSRVARIRRARRGTRKQSGGFIGALLSWFGKKTDAADTVANPDDKPGFLSGFLNMFKSNNPKPKVISSADKVIPSADENNVSPPVAAQTQLPTQPPPPALQTQPPPPGAPTDVVPQGGGRKTRHRRHRSPRHHRK